MSTWYIIAATSDQRRAIEVEATGELDALHVAALMGIHVDRVEKRMSDEEWAGNNKITTSRDFLLFVGHTEPNNKEAIETHETENSIMLRSSTIKENTPMENLTNSTAKSDKTSRIRFETYELPAHWACALMYGDLDGLSDEDLEVLEEWEADQRFSTFICVDIESDDSGDFRRYHDATPYGGLACDVATYTFDVGV